jgi:hypothetical protein
MSLTLSILLSLFCVKVVFFFFQIINSKVQTTIDIVIEIWSIATKRVSEKIKKIVSTTICSRVALKSRGRTADRPDTVLLVKKKQREINI